MGGEKFSKHLELMSELNKPRGERRKEKENYRKWWKRLINKGLVKGSLV